MDLITYLLVVGRGTPWGVNYSRLLSTSSEATSPLFGSYLVRWGPVLARACQHILSERRYYVVEPSTCAARWLFVS